MVATVITDVLVAVLAVAVKVVTGGDIVLVMVGKTVVTGVLHGGVMTL